MDAPAPPQGGEKNFSRNLQGKFISAPPQAEQESIYRTFLLGGGDLEVGVVHLVTFRPSVEGDD